MYMSGPPGQEGPDQLVDTEWVVQGNTITFSGTPGLEVGIYAEGRGEHASKLTLDKTGAEQKNTISGFGTGILVGTKGKASIKNSVITGNGDGVRVDGGTALIENCDLRDNTAVGLRILNNGIVDAGQTGTTPPDFTGLGGGTGSTGNNDFSSYDPAVSSAQAIRNDNAWGTPEVEAENNFFKTGLTVEWVVYHHEDDSGLGVVDFEPHQEKSSLLAARGPRSSGPAVAWLTMADLGPIVAAAKTRWFFATGSLVLLRKMSQAELVIADLPGGCLGLTEGNTIYVDRDAAGYGWFVDRTALRDEEFRAARGRTELWAVDPRAVDRMDLLTVIEHELGHVGGLEDLASDRVGLMQGTLDTGIRRVVGPLEIAAVWSQYWRDSERRRANDQSGLFAVGTPTVAAPPAPTPVVAPRSGYGRSV
jgi:hypothetical protein